MVAGGGGGWGRGGAAHLLIDSVSHGRRRLLLFGIAERSDSQGDLRQNTAVEVRGHDDRVTAELSSRTASSGVIAESLTTVGIIIPIRIRIMIMMIGLALNLQ